MSIDFGWVSECKNAGYVLVCGFINFSLRSGQDDSWAAIGESKKGSSNITNTCSNVTSKVKKEC